MAKNIILFSDGTGNKGGTGSDTNVFRLYHAIKVVKSKDDVSNKQRREQVCFYDNGVGTATNSIFRAFGGAFGAGFRENVRDLYEFTCRHFKEDDHIYGFGFSRGAATIRAYAGMVKLCGLVEIIEDDEQGFQKQIDLAMREYVRSGGHWSLVGILSSIIRPKKNEMCRNTNVEIEFLGLWDTVSAIGIPQLPKFDSFINFFRRHKFYDYEPSDIVKNMAHALSVDDERKTFEPLVWNENNFSETSNVSQVWFPGVHSNVGGGYPRAGLANISLDWMIACINKHREKIRADKNRRETDRNGGIILVKDFLKEAQDGANPSGKLYDSRSGFAIFYRYKPRSITKLCSGKCDPVQIHDSVMERMRLRTAGYGPSQIPGKFNIVYGSSSSKEPVIPIALNDSKVSDWAKIRNVIDREILKRVVLYWSFLGAFILLIGVSFYFWVGETIYVCGGGPWQGSNWLNSLSGHVADVLNYILPDFFKNIINYTILKNPISFIGFIGVVGIFLWFRHKFIDRTIEACEKGRAFVIRRVEEKQKKYTN